MKVEYEAKFLSINKDKIRETLKQVGAKLVHSEFLQKRVTFDFPKGHEQNGAWLRIRKEANKTTLALKINSKLGKIEDLKELQLNIDNFEAAEELLSTIGCQLKAFQENKRETWQLDRSEIAIDEWPFMEPFVEIESNSEESVRATAKKLGFNYGEAYFGNIDGLYASKYGITTDKFNFLPELSFTIENPFKN